MTDLASQKCVPCQGGVPALTKARATEYLRELEPGWRIVASGKKLVRRWKFKNFQDAWHFVDQVSKLAEQQNHHPNLEFGWGFATVTLWTHEIDGLFMNDFILAAKIDKISF